VKERLLLLPFALFLIILPFPGTIAVRMLTLTLAFFIAWRIWWVQRPHNEPLPGKRVIGFWVVVCLLSLIYAVDPVSSLKEMKSELLNSLAAFFAFFVIAGNLDRARYLMRALAVGLIIIGGWALVAWVGNGFYWDETGRYGGIGVFSTYLVTILPAIVWLTLADDSIFWKRLAATLLPLILLLAFATTQRAIWPALLIEFAVFLAISRRQPIYAKFPLKTVFIFVVVITTMLFSLQEKERFGVNATGESVSADSRLEFWPAVVSEIAKHPWTGGGFGRHAMKKAYPNLIPEYNTWLWHSHNVILNYGISMGIPGILSIILVFGYFAAFFWQAANNPLSLLAGAAGLALVLGVLLRNQFNDFFIRDQSLLFWAQVGLFARLCTSPSPKSHESTA